jgi:hypothetical protein
VRRLSAGTDGERRSVEARTAALGADHRTLLRLYSYVIKKRFVPVAAFSPIARLPTYTLESSGRRRSMTESSLSAM